MAREERLTIMPPRDIELDIRKGELEYFLTFPDSGIGPDTGLILAIPGWGDKADSVYQKEKLRPYLADRYDCLVCGLNYTGVRMYCGERLTMEATPNFETYIKIYHGISPQDYIHQGRCDFDALSRLLNRNGIERLSAHCRLLRRSLDTEYDSFGFLPALEHLHLLGTLLNRYPVNRRRIIAFGSSYGGYIALLLGKYAPATFSTIIDNSGFVRANPSQIVPQESLFIESSAVTIGGVDYPHILASPWTLMDENSPRYFSDSHRQIRSLLIPEHLRFSETQYEIFHSEQDEVAPTSEKDRFVDLLKRYGIAVHYRKIGRSDLDGKVFKNIQHSMSASLRGLFDMVAEKNHLEKNESSTDYDFNHVNQFDCGDRVYRFNFGASGLQVEIGKRTTSVL